MEKPFNMNIRQICSKYYYSLKVSISKAIIIRIEQIVKTMYFK